MNIILLAAGLGSRLGDRTKNTPKCMVEVNGTMIIDRLFMHFKELDNVAQVAVVTGFEHHQLENHILSRWGNEFTCNFIHNKIYDQTNNMYSLYLAKSFLKEPFLIVESDVVLSKNILKSLDPETGNCWFTDQFTRDHDGCMLTTSAAGKVQKIEIVRQTLDHYTKNLYKSMGIVYMQDELATFVSILEHEVAEGNTSIYYDLIFAKYIEQFSISVLYDASVCWMEIDNEDDLKKAEQLFRS